MNRPLRVVVADDEPDMLQYLETTLPLLGHQVVASARTGAELVEQCRAARPDLVITDIKMPGLDGIDAVVQSFREAPAPVILVSGYHTPDLIERVGADCIFGYLVKPIKEGDLGPAIAVAMRRFRQFQALAQEAGDLRQAPEDRKAVERAKGLLMKRAGVGEEEAYRRLQRLATDRRCKLAEIARAILAAEEAFQPGP
jgi:response regulator NasT